MELVQERAEIASNERQRLALASGWLAAVGVMAALGAYHWIIYTPRPDIPHRLAILDMLFRVGVAGAIALLGLLTGLRLLRPLRVVTYFSDTERLALATGLGLGVISLVTLALGVAHLYYTPTFVALLTLGPLLFPAERRWMVSFCLGLYRTARAGVRSVTMSVETAACLALGAISLGALALCYVRDLTLPTGSAGYDTYQYHWAVPALLLRAHAWQGFAGWAHANLPFNTEILNLIAISLRAPTAANIVQDTFGALFAVLVFGLLRRHFGQMVAWLAVASLITIPLLMAYTSQSYVETALLFYGFAALTLLLTWLEQRLGASRAGIEAIGLAGVALGFAIGVKYTAIEYAPGLVALLVAGFVAMLRRGRPHDRRASWRGIGLLALVSVAGAGLAFAPWLIKNWVYLGNPVYPALGGLFADPIWNSARDQTLTATFQHFGPHTGFIARFHLFALDLFLHPDRYREGTTYTTGTIAWAALLAAPALAFGWWRGWLTGEESRRGRMLVIAGLAVVIVCAFATWTASGALVERYAIPPVTLATVLGALILGWIATTLLALGRARRPAVTARLGMVAVCVGLLAALTFAVALDGWRLYLTVRQVRYPLPLITGSISETQYQETRLGAGIPSDYWQMVNYVNSQLPRDGKLLMLARGTGYFFSDRSYIADSGGDWVPYLVTAGKTPDGILSILHAQGFHYVVYDAGLMSWLEHVYQNQVLLRDAPTYLAFQQQHLTFIASWGDFSLYRVPG